MAFTDNIKEITPELTYIKSYTPAIMVDGKVLVNGIGGNYIPAGQGDGAASMDFYKCSAVNSDSTWSGYKAILQEGKIVSYESDSTIGLAYTGVLPVVGHIYTENALLLINLGIPKGAVFYDSLKANVNTCLTGQARSGSATSYSQTIQDVPCTYFNGVNQWIYYPSFVLQDNQSYSISVWVNKVGNVNQGPEHGFCSLSSSSIKKRISISENGDNVIQVYANSIGVGTEGAVLNDTQNIAVGTWYHIVCVVDVVDNKISYYKNGILIATSTYEHWYAGSDYNGASGFVIGNVCSWKGYENDYRTNSYISSIRVYDRVLSDYEIKMLASEFILTSN